MPREDLAKKFWNKKCDRIYDETYEKIYKSQMEKWDQDVPKNWHQESCETLATNLAEDAVDEYLVKQSEKLTGKDFGENTQKFFDNLFPHTN